MASRRRKDVLDEVVEGVGAAIEAVGDAILGTDSSNERDRAQRVVQAWAGGVQEQLGLEKFDVHADGADLVLWMLVVPGGARSKGLGTEAMERLVAYADARGNRILLTPSSDIGATSRARLVRFYKRFGFHENKGRRRDFSTREGMIRDPRLPKPKR